MTNLRRQLEFRYYSRSNGCSGNYSLIGKSSVVEPLNYNEPTHIQYRKRIRLISAITGSQKLVHHLLSLNRIVEI
jgi:hypothetical protein